MQSAGRQRPHPPTFRFLARRPIIVPLLLAVMAFTVSAVAGLRLTIREGDTGRYERLAENLLREGKYSSCAEAPLKPEFERMPGYPLFLAAIKAVTPSGDYGVVAVQSLLNALCVLAVYLIAHAITSDAALANISAAAWAMYPFGHYYALSLMTEGLTTFALTIAVLGFVKHLKSGKLAWLAVGVVSAILAAYTRPHLLALPFFWAFVALLRRSWRTPRTMRAATLMCMGMILAIGPWVWRNYSTFGRLQLGSHNFLGANICESVVQFRKTPDEMAAFCFGNGMQGFLDVCDAEENMRRDAVMLGRGLSELAAHPFRTALAAAFRPVRLWFSYWTQHHDRAWLQSLMRYGTLFLLPFFIAGAILVARHTAHGWPVAISCLFLSLTHIVSVVSSRYSQPAKPLYVFCVVYAVYGSWQNRRLLWAQRWQDIRWPGQR